MTAEESEQLTHMLTVSPELKTCYELKETFRTWFAEGVNLKIKRLNRRGFGYHNFEHFRLHVLVAFGPPSR